MKKTLIFLLLLLPSLVLAIDTCDDAGDSDEAESEVFDPNNFYYPNRTLSEGEQWSIALNQFLMQQPDINVAMTGLANLNMFYGHRMDDTQIRPLLSAEKKLSLIKQLLESQSAQHSSLIKAQEICSKGDVADLCSHDVIQQKLEESDPDNLMVYLHPLQQAFNDQDDELAEAILERMSQTTHAKSLFQVSTAYADAVQLFMQNNPMPSNSDDQKYFEELLLDSADLNIDELNHASLMMGERLGSSLFGPAYRPLSQACEVIPTVKDDCINVAQILIDKSDSIMNTMFGYSVLIKMHEVAGDEKALVMAQKQKKAFDDYWQCLGKAQAVNDGMDLFHDAKLQDMFLNGTNEAKYFEEMALYLYDKYSAEGFEDLTDPRSCGLRFVKD